MRCLTSALIAVLPLFIACGGGSNSPSEPPGSGITFSMAVELYHSFADPVVFEAVLLLDGVEKDRVRSDSPARVIRLQDVRVENISRGEHWVAVRIIRHRVVRGSTNLYTGAIAFNVRQPSGQTDGGAFALTPRSLSQGGELRAPIII